MCLVCLSFYDSQVGGLSSRLFIHSLIVSRLQSINHVWLFRISLRARSLGLCRRGCSAHLIRWVGWWIDGWMGRYIIIIFIHMILIMSCHVMSSLRHCWPSLVYHPWAPQELWQRSLRASQHPSDYCGSFPPLGRMVRIQWRLRCGC